LAWTIEYDPEAIHDLNKLDRSIRAEIFDYMEIRIAKAESPRNFGKACGMKSSDYGGTAWAISGLFASCKTRARSCLSSASAIARACTSSIRPEGN
jgi:hypothetical protein